MLASKRLNIELAENLTQIWSPDWKTAKSLNLRLECRRFKKSDTVLKTMIVSKMVSFKAILKFERQIAKREIFEKILSKSERCPRTLINIFQTSNHILRKFLNFLIISLINLSLKLNILGHSKLWAIFRTISPKFSLFEVSQIEPLKGLYFCWTSKTYPCPKPASPWHHCHNKTGT